MAKPAKLTGTVEIAIMEQLSQQAAAWLIGITPRALRDQDAPRRPDGCYDARSLTEWATSRITQVKLTDGELEKLLTVVDSMSGLLTPAMLSDLDELHSKHGVSGWLAFLVTFIEESKADIARYPDATRPKAQEDIDLAVAECHERMENSIASDALKVATVCEDCGKLRRGRKWVVEDPPADHCVAEWVCPRCEKKRAKAEKKQTEKH